MAENWYVNTETAKNNTIRCVALINEFWAKRGRKANARAVYVEIPGGRLSYWTIESDLVVSTMPRRKK